MSSAPAIRPPAAHELESAGALVRNEIAADDTLDPVRSSLEQALRAPGSEHRALAAVLGDRVVGLVAFGEISGTEGVGRVTAIVVHRDYRRQGIGTALVDAATTALAANEDRLVIVEMPDAKELQHLRQFFMSRAGFREESRVRDYYRDGVSLTFLRLELD